MSLDYPGARERLQQPHLRAASVLTADSRKPLRITFPLSRSLMLLRRCRPHWLRGYKRERSLYTSCSSHLEKNFVERWLIILSLGALTGVKTKDLSPVLSTVECFRRVRLAVLV